MTGDPMMRCLALFLLIGWTASASSQTEFRMVDGTTQVGRLVALTAEGVLTVETESAATVTLDARRLLWARRGIPEPVVHDETSPWLRFDLHGGDRIFARIADSDYDTVKLEHPRLGRLSVPLDGIREVTVLANTAGAPAIFGTELPRDRDVVFIRSGAGIDHVIGEVLRFGQGSVQFEWNDEESNFDFVRNKVIAVRLAEAERTEVPATLVSVVLLEDGSLLSGLLVKAV
ncbi:MAG: hypothetical protein KDB53_01395, partial [Planctomycetes bacterium]|nr:hypothetical protein [Planctomycetota bacterium]